MLCGQTRKTNKQTKPPQASHTVPNAVLRVYFTRHPVKTCHLMCSFLTVQLPFWSCFCYHLSTLIFIEAVIWKQFSGKLYPTGFYTVSFYPYPNWKITIKTIVPDKKHRNCLQTLGKQLVTHLGRFDSLATSAQFPRQCPQGPKWHKNVKSVTRKKQGNLGTIATMWKSVNRLYSHFYKYLYDNTSLSLFFSKAGF